MPKPQVLVFIDWYLPGFKAGGPIRSLANLVDHLRDRIDFHIVTRATDYTEDTPYLGIAPDRWTTLPGGEKVWYASEEGTSLAAWKRIMKEAQWDTIYVNGLYSWWYNILPLWLSRGMGLRRVVAVRGMLAAGAMQHGALKKLLFLSLARMLDLYKGVLFHATNVEEEREIQTHLLHRAEVMVVSNLSKHVRCKRVNIDKVVGSVRLVCVARIAVEKNTLFAIEALRGVTGNVIFDLFGPIYDKAYWRSCETAIEQLPDNVKVRHQGAVEPAAVSTLLGGYHALFMPSAGENFGHAILESLSVGRPILISDRTPWRGLEQHHAGWDLPLDRPELFTSTVEKLCGMDGSAYATWSSGSFDLATRYLTDRTPIEGSLKLLINDHRPAASRP